MALGFWTGLLIEQVAIVTYVKDGFAWVETNRQTACNGCAAHKGCGTAALARVLGRRRNRVRAVNAVGARAGDRVMVGLAEDAFIQVSLAVYLVPVLAMLVGAGAGELFAIKLGLGVPEALSAVLGLLGMAGALIWLRGFSQRIRYDTRYHLVVFRTLN